MSAPAPSDSSEKGHLALAPAFGYRAPNVARDGDVRLLCPDFPTDVIPLCPQQPHVSAELGCKFEAKRPMKPSRLSWFVALAVLLLVAAVGLNFGFPIYQHYRAVGELQTRAQVYTEKGRPDWLRRWTGDARMKLFDRVSQLFADAEFADADARNLAQVPELDYLNLDRSSVTDAGMEFVGRVTHLRALTLSGTRISDDGLHRLTGLSDLEFLSLNERITDDGLWHVGQMRELRTLWIGWTEITDEGISHVCSLPHLEELWLQNTRITDAALEKICNLDNLESLVLDGTEISDDGLFVLARLKKLRNLSIENTRITDAGLQRLNVLRTLEHLNIGRTPVTGAGIAELQRTLLKLKRVDKWP